MTVENVFINPETVKKALFNVNYLASTQMATTIFLAYKLQKPLLIEGPAGVGKTELAKSLAKVTNLNLLRLQCYEGLDEQHALFQWNYQKQLLYLQATKNSDQTWTDTKTSIFSEEFLFARPILQAFQSSQKAVLLIDEIDKADEEFESFLLEALSDYQLSIPELGTIEAKSIPFVFLTSNNSRDLSDGLRRRCIHLFVNYPSYEQELSIILAKVPEVNEALSKAVTSFVQRVRKEKLRKPPSIAETLDWAKAIHFLGTSNKLDPLTVRETLNLLLKYNQDNSLVQEKLEELLRI